MSQSTIGTGGFGVQVMPHFVAPDPNLIASHPELINAGILSSFQVASEADKLKAFKAQQDEISQLRQDRIGAISAGYKAAQAKGLADQSYIPAKNQLDLSKISGETAVQPFTNQLNLGDITNKLNQQPTQQAISNAALANDAATQGDVLTAQSDTRARAAAVAGNALDSVDQQFANEKAKLDADYQDTNLRLQNAPQTAANAMALSQAHAQYFQGLADMQKQHAEYFKMRAANPSSPAAQNLQMAREASSLRKDMTSMLKDPIDRTMKDANGNLVPMSLGAYRAMRNLPDGSPNPDFKVDPVAEASLHEVDAMASRINQLHSGQATGTDAGAPPVTVGLPGSAGATGPGSVQAGTAEPTASSAGLTANDIPVIDVSMLPPDLAEQWQALQDNPSDPNGPALINVVTRLLQQQPQEQSISTPPDEASQENPAPQ